jgi:transposase-like protein
VKVYNGYKATLGKKHVARQKLCLPGIQEFWVNNKSGMPYFYITGQANEKLSAMLENEIISKILKQATPKYTKDELQADPELPRFTIVFDREAYSPEFFKRIWGKYRVAVLTYRKNVKDSWKEDDFEECKIDIEKNQINMLLAGKNIRLNDIPFREIRRLSGKHQTSIITNNKKLSRPMDAIYMFSRWTQENFFKYLRQDYDFDRLLQYTVEQIDKDFVVVNPEYNNISYSLKKTREKISRRMAALYRLEEDNLKDDLDKTNIYFRKQIKLTGELDILRDQENGLLDRRSKISYKIKVEDVPEETRYNRLHIESKHFQNIIKMICFRAETSFANLLADSYKKHDNEKRAFVKSIINTHADIIPDYQKDILTVRLYSQSSPRMNIEIENICKILNETKTVYPGTSLVMDYHIATF